MAADEMAYSAPLSKRICARCGRPARHELYSEKNVLPIGLYCGKCIREEVDRLNGRDR